MTDAEDIMHMIDKTNVVDIRDVVDTTNMLDAIDVIVATIMMNAKDMTDVMNAVNTMDTTNRQLILDLDLLMVLDHMKRLKEVNIIEFCAMTFNIGLIATICPLFKQEVLCIVLTWTNVRSEEQMIDMRLDRVFFNSHCLDAWDDIGCSDNTIDAN
ncbi:unnamed protein product [Sphenostylis stenocarpa]|uniref:Uncharacterized protein n=1 Tax=Sphenostylis stenocarpa TaxID=92480 RepID=A0AA86V877_9FABA|nr:unnamed protein product [Sphenostylis stenocarpa]